MASKRDYYEILGVQKTSDDAEIKKAFRGLAKKYHPDANPENAEAEQNFKEINEAYEVLSDSKKRAAYDQLGHSAFDGSGGGFSYSGNMNGMDMGDIFESIFGGGFGDIFGGASTGRRKSGPRRGADVQTNIQVTFEEAIFGTDKEIQLPITETCEDCKGTGAKPGTAAESCKHCGGTGQERFTQQAMFTSMTSVRTCSICGGEGKIIKDPCNKCNGRGKVKKNKSISVTIPKGIDNGQSIRKSGFGEAGDKGGPSGDLFITIYVQPHKTFIRKENNIYIDIPITFIQAALGDEIVIPTIDGEETCTIKPGTQPDTVITLKGKGVFNVRNNRIRGDEIVKFKVKIPTKLSERQKSLLKEFDTETGADTFDKKEGFFDKIKRRTK